MRRLVIPVLTAVLLAVPAARAEESAPKKGKDKKPQAEEEVLTFTTEDFERKYGPSPKPVPQPAPAAAQDKPAAAKDAEGKPLGPLEQLQAAEQAERDKVARREQARGRVQAAQTRIAELEKRQAQLRNPLLGSVQPEEGEREAWESADQAGRLKIVEDTLAATRRELNEAIGELAKLR